MSVLLIFLIHHLFNFFKSTLTTPKIKDLVNTPNEKYKNIYNIISNNSNLNNNNLNNNISTVIDVDNSTSIKDLHYNINDLIPETNNMKQELKSFLKKQLNTTTNYENYTEPFSFSSF